MKKWLPKLTLLLMLVISLPAVGQESNLIRLCFDAPTQTEDGTPIPVMGIKEYLISIDGPEQRIDTIQGVESRVCTDLSVNAGDYSISVAAVDQFGFSSDFEQAAFVSRLKPPENAHFTVRVNVNVSVGVQ